MHVRSRGQELRDWSEELRSTSGLLPDQRAWDLRDRVEDLPRNQSRTHDRVIRRCRNRQLRTGYPLNRVGVAPKS